ncbi:hypothetical protein Salat_1109900 [Sesamum alatum]|uniref:Uncharacterized protein n=1 Tax=Sesamum alatum TaxID=300844 RepID=A0AAE2CT02_9LAMI|nr:hypothetical protein Salat_1109900 [Sesamum alatum]
MTLSTLSSSLSSNDGGGGGLEAVESASKEEEEEANTKFKFPAFARLSERVAGDSQLLQTLERLKARWNAKYGDGGASTRDDRVCPAYTGTYGPIPPCYPFARGEKICQSYLYKGGPNKATHATKKLKLKWLKEGDQCSKLFFRKVIAQRAR